MSTPPLKPTYGDRYLAAHNLPADQCSEHLLGKSLHAPLRWIWPLARSFCRYHFEEERMCLKTIVQLRSHRELQAELAELYFLAKSRKLHRRIFRIRVSTRRLRNLLQNLPDA